MTLKESSLFMALIKISYPTAYRDIDEVFAKLTVEMWHSEFASIPYQVMQMALARHRRKSNFAPTIAEMTTQIRGIYWDAFGELNAALAIGDKETMCKCKYLTDATKTVAYSQKEELEFSYLDDIKDDIKLIGEIE